MMGCVGLVGGTSSHLVLLQGYADGVGAIPNKAAQGMLESPLDPPSRFPFRRD